MEIVYFIVGILALKGLISSIGDVADYWERKGLIKRKSSSED